MGKKMFIGREYLNDNETSQGLRRLKEITSLPYADKLRLTDTILDRAFKIAGDRAAVLYSGGADSTVVLDLVRKRAPRVLVVHNNTTLGHPAILNFIREWTKGMDYHETTPTEIPFAFWKRTGYFPLFPKRQYTYWKRRVEGLKAGPVQCCYHLKEKHANAILKKHGIKVVFWGIRAGESHRRQFLWLDHGSLFKPVKYPWYQAYPMQHWKRADVERYLRENIPYYIEQLRGMIDCNTETGCLCCCTDISHWPNNSSKFYMSDRRGWLAAMRSGLAREILRAKGIEVSPEKVIRTRPHLLLYV